MSKCEAYFYGIRRIIEDYEVCILCKSVITYLNIIFLNHKHNTLLLTQLLTFTMNINDLPNEIIFEIALYLKQDELQAFYDVSLAIRRAIEHPDTGLLEETFVIPRNIPYALQHKIKNTIFIERRFLLVPKSENIGNQILAYNGAKYNIIEDICHLPINDQYDIFKKIIRKFTIHDIYATMEVSTSFVNYHITPEFDGILLDLLSKQIARNLMKIYKRCNFINVKKVCPWYQLVNENVTEKLTKTLCPNATDI